MHMCMCMCMCMCMSRVSHLYPQVLETEADVSCKRNAFLMLFHTAQDRAVEYLSQNLDQVATWGDILQLVVLELIRKIVRSNPYEKSKYIRCILTLFNSQVLATH